MFKAPTSLFILGMVVMLGLVGIIFILDDNANAASHHRCTKPILHRGWTDARTDENTLAAIRKSKGYGPAEIDVRLTQDHRMVLMHNARVNSTTDGNGYVRDMTWNQIKQLRTDRANDRVPSFRQATRVASHQNVKLVVELKSYLDWTPELIHRATKVASNARVVVWVGGRGYGFEHAIPNNATQGTQIYWRPLKGVTASVKNAKAKHADMVMDLSSRYTQKQVRRLERHHFVTAVRLTNDFARANRLGVDYALTNVPRQARGFC